MKIQWCITKFPRMVSTGEWRCTSDRQGSISGYSATDKRVRQGISLYGLQFTTVYGRRVKYDLACIISVTLIR